MAELLQAQENFLAVCATSDFRPVGLETGLGNFDFFKKAADVDMQEWLGKAVVM